jgi:hypothetical protein
VTATASRDPLSSWISLFGNGPSYVKSVVSVPSSPTTSVRFTRPRALTVVVVVAFGPTSMTWPPVYV